jgi:hypothetical protein
MRTKPTGLVDKAGILQDRTHAFASVGPMLSISVHRLLTDRWCPQD